MNGDGTTGGGSDASSTASVTIAIVSVNDTPTTDAVSDPSAIDEDTTAEQSISISILPMVKVVYKPLRHLYLQIHQKLFSDGPNITYSGTEATLTYTVRSNVNGTATVTVSLQDDGGTDNGGVDTLEIPIVVTVTAVNDVPNSNLSRRSNHRRRYNAFFLIFDTNRIG